MQVRVRMLKMAILPTMVSTRLRRMFPARWKTARTARIIPLTKQTIAGIRIHKEVTTLPKGVWDRRASRVGLMLLLMSRWFMVWSIHWTTNSVQAKIPPKKRSTLWIEAYRVNTSLVQKALAMFHRVIKITVAAWFSEQSQRHAPQERRYWYSLKDSVQFIYVLILAKCR